MEIIITKDAGIVAWSANPGSNSASWGVRNTIPNNQNQAAANVTLAGFMGLLGANEALCLTCHGNDNEVGDAGAGGANWGWTQQQIARLLVDNVPANYAGPILINACAEQVSNFSAGLAVALQGLGRLYNVWIYGYNRSVGINVRYPSPNQLGNMADLQGSMVRAPR